MPQDVLHIDFNRETLSGTIKSLQSARDRGLGRGFIDPDLGYGKLNAQPTTAADSDEALYWLRVFERIRALVTTFRGRIEALILTGTMATDARFIATLRDALYDVVSEPVAALLASDLNVRTDEREAEAMARFATARGAAEFAKRRQEGPNRCNESKLCKQRRQLGLQVVSAKQRVNGRLEL